MTSKDSITPYDRWAVFIYAGILTVLLTYSVLRQVSVTYADLVIIAIISVLLLADRFTFFRIPGLVEMRREVKTIKENTQRARELAEASDVSPAPGSPQKSDEANSILSFFEDGEYVASFAKLRASIESELRRILEKERRLWDEPGASRRATIGKLVEVAVKRDKIDQNMGEAVLVVVNTANRIIHSNTQASDPLMRNMLNVGVGLLDRLHEVRAV